MNSWRRSTGQATVPSSCQGQYSGGFTDDRPTQLDLIVSRACLGTPAGIRVAAVYSYDAGPADAASEIAFDVVGLGYRIRPGLPDPSDRSDFSGAWAVARDGGVFSDGLARFHGSTGAVSLNQPIAGMAPTEAGTGYWLVAADGGVFAFDAPFFGSTGSLSLNLPVVGMAATSTGRGYWLVASDGGVFAFGDARFCGAGRRRSVPAVGVATDGTSYSVVYRDGSIPPLCNSLSVPARSLNAPIVGVASAVACT